MSRILKIKIFFLSVKNKYKLKRILKGALTLKIKMIVNIYLGSKRIGKNSRKG